MSILNKLKKFSVLTTTLVMLQAGNVSADPADDLKEVLENGTYTIRYENVTPQNQNDTMKEKTRLVQSGSMYAGLEAETNFDDPYAFYRVVKGVATSDGKNYYSEYSVDLTEEEEDTDFEYANCALVIDDDLFTYRRTYNKKNEPEYVGNKGKNKVEATVPTYNSLGYKYVNFGDFAVTELLNALIFNERKPQGSVIYEKVNYGEDSDGLEYVDYKGTNLKDDVFLSAIRYYFKDGQLVKIYAGRYTRKDGVIKGNRLIVNVKEFKPSAERELLKLPAKIKDVTKRDNKK